MSEHMPDRMPKRMPGSISDRMSEYMPERMSDTLPEYNAVYFQMICQKLCQNGVSGLGSLEVSRSKVLVYSWDSWMFIPPKHGRIWYTIMNPPLNSH